MGSPKVDANPDVSALDDFMRYHKVSWFKKTNLHGDLDKCIQCLPGPGKNSLE